MKRNDIVESDKYNTMHFINNKHAVQSCRKDAKYCANLCALWKQRVNFDM